MYKVTFWVLKQLHEINSDMKAEYVLLTFSEYSQFIATLGSKGERTQTIKGRNRSMFIQLPKDNCVSLSNGYFHLTRTNWNRRWKHLQKTMYENLCFNTLAEILSIRASYSKRNQSPLQNMWFFAPLKTDTFMII